ncbi:uncharacterized protein J3D65DRAFT_672290 [Phyllosticta citribraziliensis]|uniref:BTB domain-containing protein n=1 Tax=Phyllosticta citribraziliensis TaxID=989973 RepID=A0ABR1L3T3_9PEZI
MSSNTVVPKPPIIDEDAPVSLNVGGTKFITAPETLARSGFFKEAFSPDNLQDDGSLFVDFDPEIFKHVLDYLRTGLLPPCFRSIDQGFDHHFAMALKNAAKHFEVERLYEWLDKKQYLETAKVETITEDIELNNGVSARAYPADELVEHHVSWAAKKVPICPRGIPVHTPNASVPQCGQQCRLAASQGAPTFKSVMVPSSVVVVRKRVVFDDSICQS